MVWYMFKKITTSQNHNYKKIVDYAEQKSYHERLKSAEAIDLRNNSVFVDLKNGYGKIIPKNKNIKF